nr:type I restriction enzyme endonuclease domain-containing protein [Halomonas cerina]
MAPGRGSLPSGLHGDGVITGANPKSANQGQTFIPVEVTDKLRKSTTVDWQVRESVRARLRILVRRTLQRYKYPPDKAPEAVELVLKQAEALSSSWVAV